MEKRAADTSELEPDGIDVRRPGRQTISSFEGKPQKARKSDVKFFEDLPEDVQKVLTDKHHMMKADRKAPTDVLEGKYMIRLILYLDKMSPVVNTDIYNDVARNEGMPRKLDALRDAGIVEMYRTPRTNMNIIAITPKGKAIAEHFKAILEIMETDPEEFDDEGKGDGPSGSSHEIEDES